MKEGEGVSETAMIMASLRALSNYEEEERIRSNDKIAECFLPEERKSALTEKSEREKIKALIPKGLENIKIFEVDAKPTQEYKISLLHKFGIEISKNITYVAVDFEKDQLFKKMYENGYSPQEKTLFI